MGPIAKEIVGREATRFAIEVAAAMQRIRARLDTDAGHSAFGVAELRIKGGGLDFEFLDDVGGRDVRRRDFVGVRSGCAGDAVNRQVAAVSARTVHCISDDVRRLEGAVQLRIAPEGYAGRQSDQGVWIAMD